MSLVSLAQVKDHLRIPQTTTDRDVDVQRRIDQAGAIVSNYLKAQADPTWDEYTTPMPVQAGVLLVLAHFDEHRGDDMQQTDEAFWMALERLLTRFRDPALA